MLTWSIALCVVALFAATAAAHAAEPPEFGPAVEISPPLPHPYYTDPDLALRDDRAVAVWNKARPGTQSWVQAAELDESGQPDAVTSIVASTNSGWDNDPSVALSSEGTAAVAWEWSGYVGTPSPRLSILDAGLATGLAQWLGEGYDPVVRYPASGDGLIAWSGNGELKIAPIDPSGAVGTVNPIPLGEGVSRAFDPVIEFVPDGGRVYWTSRAGVKEARVNGLGEPESVATLLPPPEANHAYRDLAVSGQLLVVLQQRSRRMDLICVPLAGGAPTSIDSGRARNTGPIRVGSVDVDTAGSHGLIGWVHHNLDAGSWVAKAATVDRACRVSRSVSLPTPGRRAYDTQVGHSGGEPLALVAGGGGLESVDLSRAGKVRTSGRVGNTRPLSKKLESRVPVDGLELGTEPGSRPAAVWSQTHRGPGSTIAATVAR
jgi:hypothetical protein